MSVLLDDVWHVARKAHQCCVCWGTIAPGDRYHRQRVVQDGDPGVFKCHALCDLAYWWAHTDLGLDSDEAPDWHEDMAPLVAAFFAAWAAP